MFNPNNRSETQFKRRTLGTNNSASREKAVMQMEQKKKPNLKLFLPVLCSVCRSNKSPWICLTCLMVHCGR